MVVTVIKQVRIFALQNSNYSNVFRGVIILPNDFLAIKPVRNDSNVVTDAIETSFIVYRPPKKLNGTKYKCHTIDVEGNVTYAEQGIA